MLFKRITYTNLAVLFVFYLGKARKRLQRIPDSKRRTRASSLWVTSLIHNTLA